MGLKEYINDAMREKMKNGMAHLRSKMIENTIKQNLLNRQTDMAVNVAYQKAIFQYQFAFYLCLVAAAPAQLLFRKTFEGFIPLVPYTILMFYRYDQLHGNLSIRT